MFTMQIFESNGFHDMSHWQSEGEGAQDYEKFMNEGNAINEEENKYGEG